MDYHHIEKISGIVFSYKPKEDQLKAVYSYYMDMKDTIVIAPTGFGKSYIYQIAPFLYDHSRYIRHRTPKATAAVSEDKTTTRPTTISQSNITSDTSAFCLTPSECSAQAFEFEETPILTPAAGIAYASTPTRPVAVQHVENDDMDNLSSWLGEVSITTPSNHVKQFLIVMPLNAMISDALVNLKRLAPQVSAVHLTAATITEAKLASMLFCSPEFILSQCGRTYLQCHATIKAVFIDEFHIISAWGLSENQEKAFRESYGQLGQLRAYLKDVPFVCLSATAPKTVVNKVTTSLRLVSPNIIEVEINKVNICYHKLSVKGSVVEDFNWLVRLLNETKDTEKIPRTLIFFNNINVLADAYAYVSVKSGQIAGDKNSKLAMFHLNTLPALKQKVISDLGEKEGQLKIVFCSSSLSMGINLSMIKYTVHYGPPNTADSFLQETGRAGREKDLLCHSILLTYPRMRSGRRLDESMLKYAKSESGCLREILLAKFRFAKPIRQTDCCMRCHPDTVCQISSLITDSFDSSITESLSDTDSIASIGSIESIPEI